MTAVSFSYEFTFIFFKSMINLLKKKKITLTILVETLSEPQKNTY